MADKQPYEIPTFHRERLPRGHKRIRSKNYRKKGYDGNVYMQSRYHVWESAPPRACPTASDLVIVVDDKLNPEKYEDRKTTANHYVAWRHYWCDKDASGNNRFHATYHVYGGPLLPKDARKLFNQLVREATKIEKKYRATVTIDTPGERLRCKFAGGAVGMVGSLVTLEGGSNKNDGAIWRVVSERDTFVSTEAEHFDEDDDELTEEEKELENEHLQNTRYRIKLVPVFTGTMNPANYRPKTKLMDDASDIRLVNLTDLARAVVRLKEILDDNLRLNEGALNGANGT